MENLLPFLCRYLPEEFVPLIDLALDVRWTWNHSSDKLWKTIDPQVWEVTRNPWWIMQSIPQKRIEEIIDDQEFRKELRHLLEVRQSYLSEPGWFRQKYPEKALGCVAYFSMEFGLGEAIPLYAGGLGILAGDYLKTASDLNIPMVGIGLLYQEGYFRQILADDGSQITANPHNDPTNLPIRPVTDASGGWLRVPLELPGRRLLLRVWQVHVGHVMLYLLDSNDPTNDPADRSLIYKLYDERPEFRLVQEMALGICGWRILEALGIKVEICHLNEGHAAFVALERARSFMRKTGQPFPVALWATRAGNVFTTHTAVAAGFDIFPPTLIKRYFDDYAKSLGISSDQLLALGRQDTNNADEPFNMATLAARASISVNGVSRLHEEVSRRIFQPLYPRWPEREVPVGHITNGVHMSSWDSKMADTLWMNTGGRGCWCKNTEVLSAAMQNLTDDELWQLRTTGRKELVAYVRKRMVNQFRQYAADSQTIEQARKVLDPDVLTLGFARRFAIYKRPNLILRDQARLMRILTNPAYPVQLVVAGKAHPKDEEGKRLVQEMVSFARQPVVRHRVVFLPDYDMELAQHLVQGVDVWVNTPRRPWEACGTSGMKVLVNGGLNLSELDGWWAEAYNPEVGWALGDGREHDSPEWDALEAAQLYQIMEQIITEFYDRNAQGIPLRWVSRIRASMSQLAPQFSSNRMLRDYVEKVYLPAARTLRKRIVSKAKLAAELFNWQKALQQHWHEIRFGDIQMQKEDTQYKFEAEVYLGEISPEFVSVEIYADPSDRHHSLSQPMLISEKLHHDSGGYLYEGYARATRPAEHFSLRVIPAHPAASIPLEDSHILWQYPIPQKKT